MLGTACGRCPVPSIAYCNLLLLSSVHLLRHQQKIKTKQLKAGHPESERVTAIRRASLRAQDVAQAQTHERFLARDAVSFFAAPLAADGTLPAAQTLLPWLIHLQIAISYKGIPLGGKVAENLPIWAIGPASIRLN
jgi:hypothetical protein